MNTMNINLGNSTIGCSDSGCNFSALTRQKVEHMSDGPNASSRHVLVSMFVVPSLLRSYSNRFREVHGGGVVGHARRLMRHGVVVGLHGLPAALLLVSLFFKKALRVRIRAECAPKAEAATCWVRWCRMGLWVQPGSALTAHSAQT